MVSGCFKIINIHRSKLYTRRRRSSNTTYFSNENDWKFQPFSLCYYGISWWNLNIYTLFLLLHIYRHCFYCIYSTEHIDENAHTLTVSERSFLFANTFLRGLDRYRLDTPQTCIVYIAKGSAYLRDICEANRNPHGTYEITSTICYNVHI